MILLAHHVIATDHDTVNNTLRCSSTRIMYNFSITANVRQLETKIVCNASDTGKVCVCVCVCRPLYYDVSDDSMYVHVYIRYTITSTRSSQSIQRWALSITHLYNHHYPLTSYLKALNVSYMVVPSVVTIQLTG